MSLQGTATPGQYLTGKINKLTFQIITAYGIAVKNGFKGTEEEWLASLYANPDVVEQFVNEYLDENPVVTDTSLGIAGRAADAKATGDAIERAKSEANSYTDSVKSIAESALPLSGGNMFGAIYMENNRIRNLPDPMYAYEAARKKYVDDSIANYQIPDGSITPEKMAVEFATLNLLNEMIETRLHLAGGTMNGPIAMGGNRISGLGSPLMTTDAANKSYVDNKRLSGTVTLSASGWSSGAQEVTVSGILATDMPHWGVVYGTNTEAEKEAFALVDELESQDGAFVFRCFGDVPTVDLNIQWEVNR